MNAPLRPDKSKNEAWQVQEEVLDRFEIAWREQGNPEIEEFLPAIASSSDLELLCELIKIDFEYRWDRQDRRLTEDYLRQFPQLAGSPVLVGELVREECQLRQFHGCSLAAAELQSRFPGLEISELAPTADLKSKLQESVTRTGRFPGTPSFSAAAPAVPSSLGRFEIREAIGKGGFSSVYRGWDPELQRDVAIKVPHAHFLSESSLIARLLREATSAARLRHPAIVAIHEVGRDSSSPFIVYEFVPGPTLAQVMRETSASPQQIARWVGQIAEALHYAHSNGIVHRDVKPANIMMGPDGQAKLADFGLALQTGAAGTLTQEGDVIGTPAYMSPEQAAGRGHSVDARTDVYSLGVVLYELLCGQLPFAGGGVTILHRVIHEEPVAPRQVRSALPLDLETICLRAMAKEPGRRYPTAGALVDDLQRFLDHRPIRARRMRLLGRAALWCRRQPALAATIASALICLTFIGAVSFFQIIQERDNFRQERDRAQANLYRALAGETRALIKARDTGWWWKAMQSIGAAANLEAAPRDVGELRELAIECMGTKYPCIRSVGVLPGLTGKVRSVALAQDASWAAATDGASIYVWGLLSTGPPTRLGGVGNTVTNLAFDKGGRWLASTALDGKLRFWDLALLSVRATTPGFTLPEPPPTHVVSLGAGALYALAFGVAESWLVVGCQDGTVRALSVDSDKGPGSERRSFVGHKGPVTSVAVASDGKLFASASTDRSIHLWRLFASEPWTAIAARSPPNSLIFGIAGHNIVWSDNETFGFDLRSLNGQQSIPHSQLHTAIVTQVRGDRGSRLISASIDGSFKLWENANTRIQELAVGREEAGAIYSLAWSPESNRVVTGSDNGRVQLWEIAEPEQRKLAQETTQGTAFLGSSNKLVKAESCLDFSKEGSPAPEFFTPPNVTALVGHPTLARFAYGDARGSLYLRGKFVSERQKVLSEHQGPVTGLASSPNGDKFASVGGDGQAFVWSWSDGKKLLSCAPGLGELVGLTWTGDGERVILLGLEGALLWDLSTNRAIGSRLEKSYGCGAAAAHDDLIVLGARDGALRIYNARTGAWVKDLSGHTAQVVALAYSPDGKRLASAADNQSLCIWDAATDKEIASVNCPAQSPSWLAWDPAGARLITGSRARGLTSIWKADSLLVETSFKDRLHYTGCFLGQTKDLILGQSAGAISICSRQELIQLQAQAERLHRVSGGGAAWAQAPRALLQGGHVGDVWGVASSPDGRWIATAAHDMTVKLWDAQARKLMHTLNAHAAPAWCVAFSPDSKYLAAGGLGAMVWSVESGKELKFLKGHKLLVSGLAFDPSGKFLATCSYDGSVRLWDFASGKSISTLFSGTALLHGLAFSTDGAVLAVAGDDRRIRIWNRRVRESRSTDDKNQSPDVPWQGEPDQVLVNDSSAVRAVAFDPQGQVLASGADQGAITLWSTRNFERVVTLRGGTGQIRSLAFSHDGNLLAGGAYVSPTIVWNLQLLHVRLRELKLDW